MSLAYAEQRIKEALTLAKGNQARARQHIIAWAQEDPDLLRALTKHHLTGIAAYHVERVASGRAAKPKAAPPPAKPAAPKARTEEDAFGAELLKAVASSSSAIFGLEGGAASSKRGQASQQHINAIKKMATKNKNLDLRNFKRNKDQ